MKELKSDNYIPGTQGWIITADGEAEFQNGVFRGSIVSSTITGGIIRTAASGARIQLDSSNYLQAYDANGLRVKLDTEKLTFWDANGNEKGHIKGDSPWLEIEANYTMLLKAGLGYTLNLRCGDTSPMTMTSDAISIQVNTAPTNANCDLGNSIWKWKYIYRTNESGCELPTTNSAIDIIKKIRKPKIKKGEYGERHYFEDNDFPKEMKCTHKGKTEIEFTRTIGVLVQSMRELLEINENLDNRLQKLEYGKSK